MVGADAVTSVDITAADMLMKLDDTLRATGIDLCLAEVKVSVKDKFKRFGLHPRPRRGAFLLDDQQSRGRLPQNSPSAVAGLGGPTPVNGANAKVSTTDACTSFEFTRATATLRLALPSHRAQRGSDAH